MDVSPFLDAKSPRVLKLLSAVLLFPSILCSETPDKIQKLLAIQDAATAGNLDTASRLLNQAFQRYPNDGGLFNLRGVIHARRNELLQARQDFARAVDLAPALTPAWQNLARACQMLAATDPSASDCAVRSWHRVAALKPDDPEAHTSLASLYERKGEFSRSLEQLQELPSGTSASTLSHLLKCADLAALGRTEEAEKLAGQLAADPDLSEPDYEDVSNAFDRPAAAAVAATLIEALDRRHAAGPVALRQLAIAFEQLNRLSEARNTLERLVSLEPRNTAHLLELARLADVNRNYEAALGYLAHARDLDPQNARIHFLFAVIAAKMDLPVETKHSVERALALDPDNPDYNYSMGVVILASRDASTAASYFEKFVQSRPSSPSGHFSLGVAYFASGDYDKARNEMLRSESGPKAAEAEYFLGRMARQQENLDEALNRLQKAVSLKPAYAEPHIELARVYLLQDTLEKAHAELNLALKLDPQNFQANNQLLVLYKRMHDPRAAGQQQLLGKLDEERSRRAELMLRTVEFRP